MTQVAIYARYSSDNQRDASIEDQVRLCRERAIREGWRIQNVYTDHAVSGASLLRPGIQMLMQDAMAGRFEIVLAEALDRLSRDQEDIAGFFKRMRFAKIRIVTLSEGEVGNLHIGLKGTMNAIFLQDLADKTRRGLRGRVEAGKSGGGNAFGYDVVRRFDNDGAAIRGDRKINLQEAGIVRRIFEDYAAGVSPKAIARRLNDAQIRGPSGAAWGASTIHGHRERGTGILNNELYIGRLVWNRLRYVKDPDTGKRVSRLNPSSEWIVTEVPDLRVLDQTLWDAAKARQGGLVSHKKIATPDGFWDRRRPRTLFSGLMKCGVCGGGFSKISAEHFGCSTARNKGTCNSLLTIRRDRLESEVLDGLQHHLMDPDLCGVFAEEYTRHMNRLRIEANAAVAGHHAELARVTKELDRAIDAILNGIPADQLKERMIGLEARKAELKALVAERKEEPVLIHPEMGRRYREQVARLRDALNLPERRAEAAELIRSLVDKIVLTPEDRDGRQRLAIDLSGHLAGILTLASGKRKPLTDKDDAVQQVKLVAGTGFEPVTFRL